MHDTFEFVRGLRGVGCRARAKTLRNNAFKILPYQVPNLPLAWSAAARTRGARVSRVESRLSIDSRVSSLDSRLSIVVQRKKGMNQVLVRGRQPRRTRRVTRESSHTLCNSHKCTHNQMCVRFQPAPTCWTPSHPATLLHHTEGPRTPQNAPTTTHNPYQIVEIPAPLANTPRHTFDM
jgi:hypothetical protein